MLRSPLRLALAALLVAFAAAPLAAEVTPRTWLDHVEGDLSVLWLRDDLAGEPAGAFPTFLCADGSPFDRAEPCPSLRDAGEWITRELDRQYVRMISRQIYTYGAIYHLTGSAHALDRARAGTRFLMERAWDPETGSVATYFEGGRPGPEPPQRTTQSLAYALLGPAFVYYLTRDPEVLELIHSVRRHIFERYWSDAWRMLAWTLEDAGEDTADRQELVAQLDQINAYLLLLAPLLDDETRPSWEADIRRLVDAMLRDFLDRGTMRFYGYLHDEKGRLWGERHNDFGHTAKAFWMLYLAGRHLGEDGWVETARRGLDSSLQAALVRRRLADAPEWQRPVMRGAADEEGVYHVWSNRPDGIGIPVWEWCELDQAAATLALEDRRFAAYLEKSYPTFFATLVDPVSGGTYGFPGATAGAKAHQWQNGYHVAEHALVGYVTTSLLQGQPFRLYFAFPDAAFDAPAPPYFFAAPEAGRQRLERLDGGLRKLRVTFAPR